MQGWLKSPTAFTRVRGDLLACLVLLVTIAGAVPWFLRDSPTPGPPANTTLSPSPSPFAAPFTLTLWLAPNRDTRDLPGFSMCVSENQSGEGVVESHWATREGKEDRHEAHFSPELLVKLKADLAQAGLWNLTNFTDQSPEPAVLYTRLMVVDGKSINTTYWRGLDDRHGQVAAVLMAHPVFGAWVNRGRERCSLAKAPR